MVAGRAGLRTVAKAGRPNTSNHMRQWLSREGRQRLSGGESARRCNVRVVSPAANGGRLWESERGSGGLAGLLGRERGRVE